MVFFRKPSLLVSACLIVCSCLPPPPAESKIGTQEAAKNRAYLEGFVVELDGLPTHGDGTPIELSPGCHIAKTTADALVQATSDVVVMWKQVPVTYFRLDARPGYHYRVDRKMEVVEGRLNVLIVLLGIYDDKNNLIEQRRIAYGPYTNPQRPVCPKQAQPSAAAR